MRAVAAQVNEQNTEVKLWIAQWISLPKMLEWSWRSQGRYKCHCVAPILNRAISFINERVWMRLLRMSAIFLGERYYIKIYIISSLCFHFCTLPLLFCLTSAFCLLCAAAAAAQNELRSRHSGLTTFIDNHAPQFSLALYRFATAPCLVLAPCLFA